MLKLFSQSKLITWRFDRIDFQYNSPDWRQTIVSRGHCASRLAFQPPQIRNNNTSNHPPNRTLTSRTVQGTEKRLKEPPHVLDIVRVYLLIQHVHRRTPRVVGHAYILYLNCGRFILSVWESGARPSSIAHNDRTSAGQRLPLVCGQCLLLLKVPLWW